MSQDILVACLDINSFIRFKICLKNEPLNVQYTAHNNSHLRGILLAADNKEPGK